MTSTTPRHGVGRAFLWPTIIGLFSAIGLASALFGDGGWDAVSWVTLSIPMAAILWGFRRSGTV